MDISNDKSTLGNFSASIPQPEWMKDVAKLKEVASRVVEFAESDDGNKLIAYRMLGDAHAMAKEYVEAGTAYRKAAASLAKGSNPEDKAATLAMAERQDTLARAHGAYVKASAVLAE